MIEADHLMKDYGVIRAVDNVSFQVKPGDVLGFLGPNGAGKSTTMKMLTGFLPPSEGTARIGGKDIRESPREAKKLFGYLPENCPLYHEMTVLEFLECMADLRELRGSQREEKIDRVLDICHLDPVRHQTIETLSKGYKQRIGMAQAVIHDPPYLIMDEPTDGLDPNQKKEVRKLISSMAKDKAIILSTHILEEVEAMCNRIIIIAKGKILVNETPEELRKRHPEYNSVKLIVKENITSVKQEVQKLDNLSSIKEESDSLTLIPKTDKNLDESILSLIREKNLTVLNIEKPSAKLEDVFAELTLGRNQKGNCS